MFSSPVICERVKKDEFPGTCKKTRTRLIGIPILMALTKFNSNNSNLMFMLRKIIDGASE
jgi:hypothetical protein